jgi:LPS-assembly protein
MNARVFWFTTWLLLFHPQFCLIYGQASTQELPPAPEPAQSQQAERPIPIAVPVEEPPLGAVVRLEADHQSKDKNLVTLSGNVVVHYLDYIIHSQEITYDDDSGLIKSAGKVELDGGPDHEHITAASADINLKTQSAHFFSAVGTVQPPPRLAAIGAGVINPSVPSALPHAVLQSTSPFLFTAKEVVKEGPDHYTLYNGVVTSCELPHPDWAFHLHRAELDGQTARLHDSFFTLVNIPVFYFPYATHSMNAEGRQSGFLIPIGGESSTKGLVLGDEYYWAINRSMDLQLGLDYFSLRGYSPLGQFRYKGRDLDFAQVRFTALKDRGQPGTGIDQGGTDIVFNGRHDFTSATRVAGNIEYLSSYVYRQAFAESFNQAVASEVKSDAFVVHEANGYAEQVTADRYQNFQNTTGEQVRILHVPTLELDALDHELSRGFYWNGRVAADGLERAEPNFSTSGIIERLDAYPHLGYVWHGAGWTFRPEVAGRETFYNRSGTETPPLVGTGPGMPQEVNTSLSRRDGEASVEVLAPAMEREFATSGGWTWRHVVQPEFHYQFVGGINNFRNVLRFDQTDIASDTNEVEYGLTQRFYARHQRMRACKANEVPSDGSKLCSDKQQETIRWFVGQKYFLDPSFGGAVVPDFRNVLQTTLVFSGAAYLTSERNVSPVISRLRWSSTQKVDVEWDVDYDTKRGDLLSSNTFVDFHQAEWSAGAGVSRLIEPAEISLGSLPPQSEDFLQVRWSLGYGGPAKRGFSAATTGGYDVDANAVQYSVVQSGYNWNCCGVSVEYRRFALGSTRNENQYLFNLTLAGVGTAGNLKRAERLF